MQSLSLLTRCALCLSVSVGYVLGLYLLAPRHVNFNRSNDDPVLIRYRLLAATVITIAIVLSILQAYEWLSKGTVLEGVPSLLALGFRLDTALQSCLVTAILMSVFYAGPLTTRLVFWATCIFYEVSHDGRCSARTKSVWEDLRRAASLWLRQLRSSSVNVYGPLRSLLFAPVSEELVFRATMVVILFPSIGSACIWIAPLFFAPAHLHHGLQKYLSGVPVTRIMAEAAMQLLYTYIFGAVATMLLLRTGNVLAPILSHVICNYIQLPDTSFMLPPPSDGDTHPHHYHRSTELSAIYRHRHILLAVHAGGLLSFAALSLPLTEALASSTTTNVYSASASM